MLMGLHEIRIAGAGRRATETNAGKTWHGRWWRNTRGTKREVTSSMPATNNTFDERKRDDDY